MSNDNTTLLIVDDEPDLCEMLAFEFSVRGYRTFQAMDGQLALNIFKSEPVAAIVSDYRMPILNGLELVERVKHDNPNQPVVVLITAYADVALAEALHRGAEDLFSKPFRLSDLAETLRRLLVPPQKRWASGAHLRTLKNVDIHFDRFDKAKDDGLFDAGRGGFFVYLPEALSFPGQRLAFSITFDDAPWPLLRGAGVVRWSQAQGKPGPDCPAGLEIEYLDDKTRETYVQWIETEKPRAYLPNLLLDAQKNVERV